MNFLNWLFFRFQLGFYSSILLGLSSCKEDNTNNSKNQNNRTSQEENDLKIDSLIIQKNQKKYSIKSDSDSSFNILSRIDSLQPVDLDPFQNGLIDVQSLDSRIRVDIKYATTNNFMNRKVYGNIQGAYLQPDVAKRLAKCQKTLKEIDSSLNLLIYDAVRPLRVQYLMWKLLDTIPVAQRTKFVSNPANHSIHNYGAAVDLTICDMTGKPLDMGAAYDDIRPIAYPKFEAKYLSEGKLSKQQIANRQLLRKVLKSEGFSNIPTEWWHFNACSRNTAKAKYKVVN